MGERTWQTRAITMVDEDGSEVASTDGNGHYEHASLIVHRHETEAERASSSTRRPALIHRHRRLIATVQCAMAEYSFIKINAMLNELVH